MQIRIVFLMTAFLTCATVTVVRSQGQYLLQGESGLGVQGGYTVNKVGEGIAGGVVFSLFGTFDFGMSVGRQSLRQGLSDFGGQYDFTAVSYSPGIAVQVLKQDTVDIPLSVGLSAGYDWDLYSSKVLDQNGYSLNSNGPSFGCTVYGNLYTSSTSYFQFGGTFGYIIGDSELKNSWGYDKKTHHETLALALGVSLVAHSPHMAVFVLTPSVSFSSAPPTFLITLGFILPTHG